MRLIADGGCGRHELCIGDQKLLSLPGDPRFYQGPIRVRISKDVMSVANRAAVSITSLSLQSDHIYNSYRTGHNVSS
jgi:hypothetical protein